MGSSLRNQGQEIAFRTPNSLSVLELIANTGVALTANQLLRDDYSVSGMVGDPDTICQSLWAPAEADDYNYYLFEAIDPNVSVTQDNHCLVCAISGADSTTPQSWYVEGACHFEVTGLSVPTSKSDTDVSGMSVIHNSLPTGATTSPSTQEANFWSSVTNSLWETGAGVAGYAIKSGGMIAANQLVQGAVKQLGIPLGRAALGM